MSSRRTQQIQQIFVESICSFSYFITTIIPRINNNNVCFLFCNYSVPSKLVTNMFLVLWLAYYKFSLCINNLITSVHIYSICMCVCIYLFNSLNLFRRKCCLVLIAKAINLKKKLVFKEVLPRFWYFYLTITVI